jgi:hypothetical protein
MYRGGASAEGSIDNLAKHRFGIRVILLESLLYRDFELYREISNQHLPVQRGSGLRQSIPVDASR